MRRSNGWAKVTALVLLVGCQSAEKGQIGAAIGSAGPTENLATALHEVEAPFAATNPPSEPPETAPTSVAASPPNPELGRPCQQGFSPSVTARADVTRLALSCGPETGLSPFAHVTGTVDEAAGPFVYRWDGAPRDCFRLFAVAEAPVDDLEVEIAVVQGARVSLTNQNRRFVVVGEDAPFCSAKAVTYEARFVTHAGQGALAVSIWRGVKMLQKTPSR